jgi:hypothetical protein
MSLWVRGRASPQLCGRVVPSLTSIFVELLVMKMKIGGGMIDVVVHEFLWRSTMMIVIAESKK